MSWLVWRGHLKPYVPWFNTVAVSFTLLICDNWGKPYTIKLHLDWPVFCPFKRSPLGNILHSDWLSSCFCGFDSLKWFSRCWWLGSWTQSPCVYTHPPSGKAWEDSFPSLYQISHVSFHTLGIFAGEDWCVWLPNFCWLCIKIAWLEAGYGGLAGVKGRLWTIACLFS